MQFLGREEMPVDSNIPNELQRLSNQPRILVRRAAAPRKDAKCVVYWMQRAMRILDNPALDVAIEAGNLLGLPVVVYFSVIPNYPNANLRHYHFLAQGLRDVAEDAAERGVGFVLRRPPDNSLEAFLEEVQAALLIGDENPCREPERWRRVLAKTREGSILDRGCRCCGAFAGVRTCLFSAASLPSAFEGGVAEDILSRRRSWLRNTSGIRRKPLPSFPVDRDITEGFDKLDRSVKPVDTFTGGTRSALRRLREFVETRSRRVRDDTQSSRDQRHQPLVAVSALRQHRPAHDCAGGRRSCRGRARRQARRAIGFLSS